MNTYKFIDSKGTFELLKAEETSYLYFPLANEAGIMSSITPSLGGDMKAGQNQFFLEPVSSENLHNNKSSRNFWLQIEGEKAWSATGMSSSQRSNVFDLQSEETKITAGLMWHQLERESQLLGIASKIVSFIPYSGEKIELMSVNIKNIGTMERKIVPVAAIPIYARSADNIRDHRNVTSMLHRVYTSDYGLVVHPTLTFDERGHLINHFHYGVFGASSGKAPISYYPIVEDFIGEGGSFENPRAVMVGDVEEIEGGKEVSGFEALGGLKFETMYLKPGEEKTYIIAMGIDEDREVLESKALRFLVEEEFWRSYKETKNYWLEKINLSYHTGDTKFDNWMQWVNFQPMLRRIFGCSFLPHHDYGKGGRGYRDLWQDCLALLIMSPNGVRQILLDNFGGIRLDGTNATIIGSKQGEFIADRNNITRVWMDHGAWPFLTTRLYLMQSGDFDFLVEKTNYFKDLQVIRGEDKDLLWNINQGNQQKTLENKIYEGTILEHILVQHLTVFYDVGEHNHLRLRGADWNDALDMAKERGESVAFTAFYSGNLKQLAELVLILEKKNQIKSIVIALELKYLLVVSKELFDSYSLKQQRLKEYCIQVKHNILGEVIEIPCKELASILDAMGDWMMEHIRSTEWITGKEGQAFYNGYYDNNGRRVEGEAPSGIRMMLTSQVFPIMSGVATNEQVASIIKAADNYLYEPELGGYRLNTNFNEVKSDLGRMFGFAYGQKENGAVFSHMAIMYGNSLYQRGFYKEGYKAIHSLYKHCVDFTKSKIYPGIPEYIDPKGRGVYHYLTGSASWLMLTVLTQMFGFRGEWGDLKLSPHLMEEQFDKNNTAKVSTRFQNKNFELTYYNPNRKEVDQYKIVSFRFNDKEMEFMDSHVIIKKDYIEHLSDNIEHKIVIVLN